ncbi:large ribosomal subunit protein uL22 [Microbacterium sp.]|uniref:large ribosomal subunit protein uL22 n=1 Tax=Microbacterium sp. TaxID=51671 RepID=UPI003A8FCF96
MVESIARVKHIRVTPQKARASSPSSRASRRRRPGHPEVRPAGCQRAIYKLVHAAIAHAQVKADRDGEYLDEQDLYVKNAYVDEGTTLKRFQPRAQGRAFQIKKRTSHITVVLATPEVADAAEAATTKKASK